MFNFEYHGTKDPRIVALSSESLTFLRLLKLTFQKIPRRYCGALHDPTIERNLKTAASNTNAKAFKAAKTAYCNNQTALKRYSFWLEMQSHYQNPETWKDLIAKATPHHQSQLQHVERRFMQHAEWAHCSSEAVYQIASDLLPALEAYFEMAELEFETMKFKLPHQVSADFKTFIEEGKSWLLNAKMSLTHAMVARLIVASKAQHIGRDDVVHELTVKLNEAGVRVKSFASPSQGLCAKHINFFQQFIAKHSSREIALHLKHEVDWLKNDEVYHLITRPYCIYVAPKKLTPLIAESSFSRWWQRVVNNMDVERYLLSQQHNIAGIRLLERQTMTGLNSQEVMKRLKEVVQLHEALDIERQALHSKMPRGFWATLWRQDTKTKLTALTHHWQESQRSIVMKSLTMLKDYIATLEAHVKDEPRPVLTQHMKEEIFKWLTIVKTMPADVSIASLAARLKVVYKKLHPEEPLLESHLKELEQGKLLGNGHLDTFYVMLKNLKTVDPHSFKAYKRRAIPARKTIIQMFTQTIHTFMLQKEGMAESTLQTLMRALLCMSHLGDAHERDSIKEHVLQLLSCYATRVTQEVPDIHPSWHAYTEAILMQVAEQMNIPELRQEAEILKGLRLSGKTTEHQEYCAKYLKEVALTKLKTKTKAALAHYETELWLVLGKKFDEEVTECLDELVNDAFHQKHDSVAALTLTPSQKTVLGIGKAESRVLYWVDQILWARLQSEHIPTSEAELQSLISGIERLTRTIHATGHPLRPAAESVAQPSLLRGAFA